MKRMWTRHDLLRIAGVEITGEDTMKRMWSKHDLLRVAGVEITGEDTMKRMWSRDELIDILSSEPGDPVEVTSVNITGATEGFIDDKVTLTATVLPANATNKTVTWQSSDEELATVANGVVTLLAEGSVTITASAGGKSDTHVIVITEKPAEVIPVESLAITGDMEGFVGDTVTLTATVLPANATNKTVTWQSSDEELATVANGVVTLLAEGSVTITASAGAFSDEHTITIEDPDSIPARYVQTTTADFDENGNYTGTAEYIILPEDKPSGYKITNINVKGVATNGDYLTNAANMFNGNNSLFLELDYLNTSNVGAMNGMFYNAQATTFDLSNFDTNSVTTMNGMFYNSKATTLDLSSFDTSKVIDMGWMFYNAQATTGYARTQTDANKFNATSGKPSTLTFVVK